MPVTFEPLENSRIMLLTVSDPWTVDELMVWYPLMKSHFDHASGKVHSLLDLTSMRTIPAGSLKGRHSPNLEHPKSGYVIFVGATGLAKSLAEFAFQLARNSRFKFMNERDAALAFLKQNIEAESSTPASGDRYASHL